MRITDRLDRRQLLMAGGLSTLALLTPLGRHAYTRNPASMTSPASPVAGTSAATFDDLVLWLSHRATDLEVPGAAIGVTMGHEQFTAAIGVTEAGTDHSFTPATRFGIASLSKIFTATALAILAQRGELSLDDAVIQHLPDLRLATESDTRALTVGHLLSHAGGWADTMEPVDGQESLDWYATQMADLPQVAPTGTRFGYSNSGFMLAGAVLERVTRKPYEDVIDESVLQPLGMRDSAFAPVTSTSSSRAHGHQMDGKELAVIPIPENPRVIYPAGGLISTLDDMLSFVRAHAGIDAGELAPDALAAMARPLITGGSVGPIVVDHIGTGWMMLDMHGETVLMSQGGDSGLISAMIAVPGRQFGMVVLANSDTAMTLVNDTVMRGLARFTGLARPEPEPHLLSQSEAANATGTFGLPDWMTFTTSPVDQALEVTASAGGETIADLSGVYTMTSPYQGYAPYLGGKIWMDLVPDDDGTITWLRFAARLLPRIG